MNYTQQLKSKKWKEKRQSILERDNFSCVKCNSKDNLQVHHTLYINGRKAWEYNNKLLITVCSSCHFEIHQTEEIKVIKSPVKKVKKIQKVKKPKIKKKPKKNKYKLSKEDKKIQKLYDDRNKKELEYKKTTK